jgi:hypothetical protein
MPLHSAWLGDYAGYSSSKDKYKRLLHLHDDWLCKDDCGLCVYSPDGLARLWAFTDPGRVGDTRTVIVLMMPA